MDSLTSALGLGEGNGHLILRIGANILMALAYFSLSFIVIHVLRRRPDVQFRGIFILFSICIFGRALTHILSIVSLWYAIPWLEASVQFFTALVLVYTVFRLWSALPSALLTPSPQQWATTNQDLEFEIEEHRKTHLELELLNRDLEERVRQRTEELGATMAEVKRLRSNVTTVCAWTKRIKDQGEWIPFEEFMTKHLGFQFTHGISEDALEELKKEVPAMAKDMRRITHIWGPKDLPPT